MIGKLVKVKSCNNRLAIVTEQQIYRNYYMLFYVTFSDNGETGSWLLKDLEVLL